MNGGRKMTVSRLRIIYSRQQEYRWGSAYIPSILATREEAPRISRPVQIPWPAAGRNLHGLSTPEGDALRLAAYHPYLFDIQEQRMLRPLAAPHPLAKHPSAVGIDLQHFAGTFDVSQRLGEPKLQSVVYPTRDGAAADPIPVPFIGDLLLYLMDARGPYCVNWTVKADGDDFTPTPPRSPTILKRSSPTTLRRELRHILEERYYADAGIPTRRVVQQSRSDDEFSIDRQLGLNLRQLFPYGFMNVGVHSDLRYQCLERFRAGLQAGARAHDLLNALVVSTRCPYHVLRDLFHQFVWRREVLVDLFQPIVLNKPLRPQSTDVLQRYASLFGRS